MDLGAYINIEDADIESIVRRNEINCPRLRGYRLMEYEEPIVFSKLPEYTEVWIVESYSSITDLITRYYTYEDENGEKHVRWDRIHGKKRKILKTALHNQYMRCRKQYDVWNKYAGRPDILYIHARIGGGNWPYYYKEVVDQPWFIEKVDDAYDSTYCDIYAKIER